MSKKQDNNTKEQGGLPESTQVDDITDTIDSENPEDVDLDLLDLDDEETEEEKEEEEKPLTQKEKRELAVSQLEGSLTKLYDTNNKNFLIKANNILDSNKKWQKDALKKLVAEKEGIKPSEVESFLLGEEIEEEKKTTKSPDKLSALEKEFEQFKKETAEKEKRAEQKEFNSKVDKAFQVLAGRLGLNGKKEVVEIIKSEKYTDLINSKEFANFTDAKTKAKHIAFALQKLIKSKIPKSKTSDNQESKSHQEGIQTGSSGNKPEISYNGNNDEFYDNYQWI